MTCQHCNQPFQLLPNGFRSEPGDVFCCTNCGGLSVTGRDKKLHIMTPEMESVFRLVNPVNMQYVDRVRFAIQQNLNAN